MFTNVKTRTKSNFECEFKYLIFTFSASLRAERATVTIYNTLRRTVSLVNSYNFTEEDLFFFFLEFRGIFSTLNFL